MSVLNEFKNRGLKDILIMCADGLKGLKEAINAVYPKTEFQRCIVHLIRNTMKYVSYKDRKELAKDLKLIYTASNEEEAYKNLQELKEKWLARKISLEKSIFKKKQSLFPLSETSIICFFNNFKA